MKKLLSLIGTISIIGSGASTVVACGSNNSSSRTSESTIIPSRSGADIIKDKITQTHFIVPKGTNRDTTNVAAIKAMKKALQTANPKLTPSDLAKITFSKETLVTQWPITVFAIIKVGVAKDSVGLWIELL